MTTVRHSVPISSLAKIIRSKNAGPFQLTVDLLFPTEDSYTRVRDSGVVTPAAVAAAYQIPLSEVPGVYFWDTALAIKVTLARGASAGALGDLDCYGAQQHAPLLGLMVPEPSSLGCSRPRARNKQSVVCVGQQEAPMREVHETARDLRLDPDLEQELLSPAYLSNPYPIYARMPHDPSVVWSEAFRCWFLTGYDDVLWAVREPKLTVRQRIPALVAGLAEEDRERAQPLIDHYAASMAFWDGPRHRTVRALFQGPFSAAAVEVLRPAIQGFVDAYLDAAGPDEIDLMPELASFLPIDVIGKMLGVPSPDRAQFGPWSESILEFSATGRTTRALTEAAVQGLSEMRRYLQGVIDERGRQPQDDFISWLIAQEHTLTDDEVLANCVQLYMAGHATTRTFMGNAFLALFRHPDQLQKLRERPQLIKGAVEELLRYSTSFQRAWRVADEDVEYQGCVIREGDPVYPLVAAANHDPAKFVHPDVLDIEGKRKPHMSFGRGIHFCLGADLARLEAAVAITTFLRRFPKARHVEERVVWGTHPPGSTLGTLHSLPVRLR